ncbi:MAG: sigma-70 family RNA polymerase sigma factor, partial [Pseudomonadota bacterium]
AARRFSERCRFTRMDVNHVPSEALPSNPSTERVARLLTRGNAAEADDLVQEALLRALRSVDGFDGRASLGTWLTSILVNLHRSEKRRAAVRRRWLERQPRDEPAEPARQEQRLEVAQTLEALDGLSEDQRAAIAMISVGGASYAEAAEALGVPLGTLMSRIARGRAMMRRRLDGPDREEGETGR